MYKVTRGLSVSSGRAEVLLSSSWSPFVASLLDRDSMYTQIVVY